MAVDFIRQCLAGKNEKLKVAKKRIQKIYMEEILTKDKKIYQCYMSRFEEAKNIFDRISKRIEKMQKENKHLDDNLCTFEENMKKLKYFLNVMKKENKLEK